MERNKRVVGLCGKRRVGKDTVADHLCSQHGYRRVSFAGPLKRAVGELFSLSEEQLYGDGEKEQVDPRWGKTPRELLQWLGTDVLREQFDRDIFVLMARAAVEKELAAHPGSGVVITDVRFENEADLVRSLGGVVVYISSSRDVAVESVAGSDHVSENSVVQGDVFVTNNGTKEALYGAIDGALGLRD